MERGWKIALWIWAGFWATIFFAATVPAHQAVSNLQSWAELFGLPEVARFLAHRGLDLLSQILSVILTILAFVHHGIQAYEARDKIRRFLGRAVRMRRR